MYIFIYLLIYMIVFWNERKDWLTKSWNKISLLKWLCECGKEVWINYYQRDYVKSCGCIKWSKLYPNYCKRRWFGHKDKSSIWYKWKNMMNRCYNIKAINYNKYWWLWISVSDEWKNFYNFFDDMYDSYNEHILSHWKSNTTLDRIDSSLWYSKQNCRRATHTVQNNNLSFNRLYTIWWVTKSISQRAKHKWLSVSTVFSRMNISKRDIDKALNTPVQIHNKIVHKLSIKN